MNRKKAIVFIAIFAVLLTILTLSALAAVEDELAADKSKTSLFVNGDFSGDDMGNFRGAITLKEGEGINGSNAVEVDQGSAAFYIFKDLQPNTAYTFAAYFKTFELDGGDPPCIVIKGWGGDDIYAPATKDEAYTRAEYSFMTGDEVKSEAEFHIWNVTAGKIMVDSMYLYLYEPPATEAPTDPPPTEAPAAVQDTPAVESADTNAAHGSESEESGDNTIIIIIIVVIAVVLLAVIIIVVLMGKGKKDKKGEE